MSAPAAESAPDQPGVMRSLEKLGLGATRALSALGLTALLFLAVLAETQTREPLLFRAPELSQPNTRL